VTLRDLLDLSAEALLAHRLRYGLSALAIAVGVASVVLLSSIGEGLRVFVLDQVSMFGTTIVGVHAGKVSTGGVPGGVGGSARKLTIQDAQELSRLPGVVAATATVYGSARVEHGSRGRDVAVFGVTGEMPRVLSMTVTTGSFLPSLDWDRTSPVTVLGPKLKRELFGEANALGQTVRIGTSRFRVIGIMESKGQYLGFDMDDMAYIPIANAMRLLNRNEVGEVDLLAASTEEVDGVVVRARLLMIDRHRGEEDVTIVTQKDALRMVDQIMRVITLTVTAIAGISLLVGAIGILTILMIVVRERVREIGLVKALGGKRGQIVAWYLCEAAVTAGVGSVAGLVVGVGGAAALTRVVPGLTTTTPPWIAASAVAMSVTVGLVAGVGPAFRAASLDPVESLRTE
jgi:putative ABC transport system permease protein